MMSNLAGQFITYALGTPMPKPASCKKKISSYLEGNWMRKVTE